MDKIEFYKRLASERASKWLQVKVPPVLDEILSAQENKSEYVKTLIIADYERQETTATAGSEDGE